MSKSFLITGGAGFLGSHLAQRLLEDGDAVCTLDDVGTLDGTYLAVTGLASHVEYIRADVTACSQIQPVLRRTWDGVFHLAAQPISVLSNKYPERTMLVNVQGTRNVCLAADRGAVGSVILASSACRYGLPEPGAAPLKEDDPARPGFYNYSESKVEAERVFSEPWACQRAIGRFVNVYGPGDRHFSRVVPRFARSLLRNEALVLTRGTGTTVLDYLYVDDAVDALIALHRHAESLAVGSVPEVFNFGVAGNHPISVVALARRMSLAFDGEERELHIPLDPVEPPVIKYLDPAKARQRLGWQAQFTLDKGLPSTIAWYCSHIHQLAHLEDVSLSS